MVCVSSVDNFDMRTDDPVELTTRHHGVRVRSNEQDKSSGCCDENL